MTDKDFLCRMCAKPNHKDDFVCRKTCKQCKADNNHMMADRNCPAFKYHCDIKKIMALNKIIYKETKVMKIQQNPTPSESNTAYKTSYADIEAMAQFEGTLGLNQPTMTTTASTNRTSTNISTQNGNSVIPNENTH